MIWTGLSASDSSDGKGRIFTSYVYQAADYENAHRLMMAADSRERPAAEGWKLIFLHCWHIDEEMVAKDAAGEKFVPDGDEPEAVQYRADTAMLAHA